MSHHGVPQDLKSSRRDRLTASARAQSRRIDVLLDKARVRIAAAVEPDPVDVAAHLSSARDAEAALGGGYVHQTHTDRRSGSFIRILDTEAADAPSDAVPAKGSKRYAVQCATHQTDAVHFAELGGARRAARHPQDWCPQCQGMAAAKTKVRNRAAAYARQVRQG
ncbi:hypothetical protein ABIA32_002335 [Streptacidiphilus sp. MAP12-20]|uniref:hypothetical protein n=1 Tax=Streptacidiphilus sp. MAP12-20 TaxID=3156299 RepID=UPI00351595B9